MTPTIRTILGEAVTFRLYQGQDYVDMGHFGIVNGYNSKTVVEAPFSGVIDGHQVSGTYRYEDSEIDPHGSPATVVVDGQPTRDSNWFECVFDLIDDNYLVQTRINKALRQA